MFPLRSVLFPLRHTDPCLDWLLNLFPRSSGLPLISRWLLAFHLILPDLSRQYFIEGAWRFSQDILLLLSFPRVNRLFSPASHVFHRLSSQTQLTDIVRSSTIMSFSSVHTEHFTDDYSISVFMTNTTTDSLIAFCVFRTYLLSVLIQLQYCLSMRG